MFPPKTSNSVRRNLPQNVIVAVKSDEKIVSKASLAWALDHAVHPGDCVIFLAVYSGVTMSSATSAVTYTSVYTDSEPDRAFWGADDEEVSEGGIPRVIILGYDGLPLQPVAPPSIDFIPGLEDPQTPPVPQDEDER
ncbi:hypothetical protein Tco_0710078 [Tanacetum coccineum]